MMGLKQVVEQNDTRWGRVFDLGVQGVILVSLVVVVWWPGRLDESRC
ncbi:MAG: hypothetical protein K9M57_10790 [Phycisphaerae bacterium]|nr:hypothetical protein [Phycisphaerae bacterium]